VYEMWPDIRYMVVVAIISAIGLARAYRALCCMTRLINGGCWQFGPSYVDLVLGSSKSLRTKFLFHRFLSCGASLSFMYCVTLTFA